MFIRHCTMIPLVTEKRSDYVDANTKMYCTMQVTKMDHVYRSIYNDDFSHCKKRLDNVDTTLYHAGHCKKRYDYVDATCTMQVTIKIDWIMLIRRCVKMPLVTAERDWIMFKGRCTMLPLATVTRAWIRFIGPKKYVCFQ